ncbi:MAG: hypothetical protein N3A71_03230 [Candidatus Dojkabacteria bacterium]|nr:hypothetical protein [Candidatus Dojkabacteria bacterium]
MANLSPENVKRDVVSNFFKPLYDFFLSDPDKQKVTAATQDHLDIYDIFDDVVLLKNGDVAMVIETTAVNFQLMSVYEQNAKIGAFADLINSLNFELQVVVHTEPINMRRYLKYLEENYKRLQSQELRKQMRYYIEFVKTLVVQNNILQKRFFVVLLHRSGVLTADQLNPFQKFVDLILGRKRIVEIPNAQELVDKAYMSLIPKRDSIMRLLSRIGLGAKQLNTKELIELFYSYYNPVTSFGDEELEQK